MKYSFNVLKKYTEWIPKVQLHWSLWVVLIILILGYGFKAFPLFVIIFGSVFLHELGHVYAAKHFNVKVDSINLNLLGGMAAFNPSTLLKPREEIIIGAAGPAVSIMLAALGIMGISILPTNFVLISLASINILLAGFNLLPLFPMDGGRILRAMLSWAFNFKFGTQIACFTSFILSAIMFAVGVVKMMPAFLIIPGFLVLSSIYELQRVKNDYK